MHMHEGYYDILLGSAFGWWAIQHRMRDPQGFTWS